MKKSIKKYKFKAGDIIKLKNGEEYRFIVEVSQYITAKGTEDYYRFYDIKDPDRFYKHWIDYVEERYEKVN